MNTFPKFTVGLQYFTLTEIKPNTKKAIPPKAFEGWMMHVRVDNLTRGSNQTKFKLLYGKLDQLYFDHARWWWLEVTPFLAYSTKEGRKWINKQTTLEEPVPHKCPKIPPSTFPKWNIIWHKDKAQKRQFSSGRSFIRRLRFINDVVKS